mgnify:CR=1 FL=1
MPNKKYTTYNQINQEFDVVSMNKTEIKKINGQEKFLVLLPKHHPDGNNQPTIRQMLIKIQNDINELKAWKTEVNTMFKQHGWTK